MHPSPQGCVASSSFATLGAPMWSADQWDVEGSNRPGEEGIFLSTDDWKSERMIVWINLDTGAWTMNADAAQTLFMDVNPHEWLASLL